MDPLTALSVAGNVVQFIQFGCQIISKEQQIYRSASGSLTENVDIETVANDFRSLSTRLKQSSNSLHGSRVTADEKALHEMCDKCIDIADDLIAHLDQLKVKGDHHRKWKSFRQALKSVWNERELDSIVDRLSMFRQELEMHILVSLKAQQNLSSLRQDYRFDALDLKTQEICTAIFENRSAFTDGLKDQTAELAKLFADQHKATQRTIGAERAQRTQRQQTDWTALDDFDPPPDKKAARDPVIDRLVEDAILNKLRFQIMTERHDEVAEAHRKTFEWIFRESEQDCKLWTNFVRWLQTGTELYWINGKAASGKSTLMRYILDNPHTRECLKKWAKEDPLNIAGFFFWNSGTREQKSHKGLLRTLLFQTLEMQRELIPLVFPRRWKTLYTSIHRALELGKFPETNFKDHWSLSELKDAFKLLATQTTVKTKICFFVDGLDEYDGDVTEMVELFMVTANSPSVKICLSSRPWLVFEDAFQGLPGLRLQDLTNNDITYFVNDKLINNRRWAQLAVEDPERSIHLVNEIVTKAGGVFLWVKLVVVSLLNGLGNHDDIEDLEKRLQLLPADLEKLYMHIITRIEPPFYLEQASKIFQVVRAAQEARGLVQISDDESPKALTIMELSLADGELWGEEVKSAHFVLSQDDMLRHAQRMANRLKTRCGGLLELGQTIPSSRNSEEAHPSEVVVYLHRTVKDYLEQDNIWKTILNHGEKTQFHPCIPLLRSSVLSLKLLCQDTDMSLFRPGYEAVNPYYVMGKTIPHRAWSVISLGMIYAHWCEVEVGYVEISLLEELDRVATLQHRKIDPIGLPWSSRRPPTIQSSGKSEWHDSFLSFAVEYGLHSFLSEKLSKDINPATSGRPLLDYAVFPISGDFFPVHPLISYRNRPKVVALLLERGASPNEEFFDKTPWQNALSYAFTRLRPQIGIDMERLLSWLKVFTLLVEHGAKTDEFCDDADFHATHTPKGTWQRQLSVLWVVNTVFMAQIPVQAANLHTALVNRGAKEERRLVLKKPKPPPKIGLSSATSMLQAILFVPYKTLDFWNWSSASQTGHTSNENSNPEMSYKEDKSDRKIDASLCNSSVPCEKEG